MAFTHILVPTDFSDPAHSALRYAVEEATVHHARITLLHILPAHTGTDVYYVTGAPRAPTNFDPVLGGRLSTTLPTPQPSVVRQDHHAEALTQLHDLMPATFAGTWEVEVATGSPAEAIIHVAQERAVDLIVMGTHGRTGLQHVLLGSIAEKVVRLAPCPVLTVRHHVLKV
jgi:nucleotide-binding universal stress UspA family protein